MNECSVEGCIKPVKSRGWCNAHYEHWRRHGEPVTVRLSLRERFDAKWELDDGTGCWNWLAGNNSAGYGVISLGRATEGNVLAHRLSYKLHAGEIQQDLELDHLCRNVRCVNPDHLEPVTHQENVLRGVSPPAFNARKTHCDKGHPLTAGKSGRTCKVCARESAIERRKVRYQEFRDGNVIIKHGTVGGYSNYGCRCDECTEASKINLRNHRATLSARIQ